VRSCEGLINKAGQAIDAGNFEVENDGFGVVALSMKTDDSPYYSMEFVDEDDRLYVVFRKSNEEIVMKREVSKNWTVENYLEKMGVN
jgi:hypothetical protein